MPIIISNNMTLARRAGVQKNNPVIGWHTVVGRTNVTADSSHVDWPVSNLGNHSTASQWRSASLAVQRLTVSTNYSGEIDYIAIARHNLGSSEAEVKVYAREAGAQADITLSSGVVPPDDGPFILRFDPSVFSSISIEITPKDAIPQIGILYIGALTVMQMSMDQEPVALKYAQKTDIVSGMAESGDFLGRIITGEAIEVDYHFTGVDYAWFIENMDGMALRSMITPFFFAWLPNSFPNEVGFGWLNDNIRPTMQNFLGEYSVNFDMSIKAISR